MFSKYRKGKKKNLPPFELIFENNILLVACKAAHSFSSVFDCGHYNPGIGESHLTRHANMLGLCKVGLMPFEQARIYQRTVYVCCFCVYVNVCLCLWSV